MRAAGPATRPMTTAPRPLSTRASDGGPRHARCAAARPPGQAARARRAPSRPRADRAHDGRRRAPRRRAARRAGSAGTSRRRSSRPTRRARRRRGRPAPRLSPQQARGPRGPRRGTLGRGRGPRAARRVGLLGRARLPQQHEDGEQVHDAQRHEDGDRQEERRRAANGCQPDEATRDQRTGRPCRRRPACPARDRARSTSAPGSLAWTVSTNHASSGPESSARKTPGEHGGERRTAQNEWATRRATLGDELTTAGDDEDAAGARTRRRTRWSAARAAKTVSPAADESGDLPARSVRPRSSGHEGEAGRRPGRPGTSG